MNNSMIELELSEEEKAELLVSLAQGLSESTVTKEVSTKSITLRKDTNAFKGPPRPVHRDGMGRYIPKTGDPPLTHHDFPTPGPMDYVGNYAVTKTKLPEYSMGEQPPARRRKFRTPAPNKYNLSRSLEWGRCKKFSLKGRPERTCKNTCTGPGPTDYGKMNEKRDGPSYTMRIKPPSVLMSGLNSSLVRLPDPDVPAPTYQPCGDEWLQRPQTFGTKPKSKASKIGPGPGKYIPKIASSGPKWHMAGPGKNISANADIPGPGSYKQEVLVPGGPKYTIGLKPKESRIKKISPGPESYNPLGFDLSEPGYTLQYRWYERAPEKTPGPAKYRLEKDPTAKSVPGYSMQPRWRKEKPNMCPGPGEYNVEAPPLNKGRTIGVKYISHDDANPGPADYQPEKSIQAKDKKPPAYSLSGWNLPEEDDDESPGPTTYDLTQRPNPTGRSIGLKLKNRTEKYGPGPAPKVSGPSPKCNKCELIRGTTVKSRHTPFKYLGLAPGTRLKEPPKDIPQAPLLG